MLVLLHDRSPTYRCIPLWLKTYGIVMCKTVFNGIVMCKPVFAMHCTMCRHTDGQAHSNSTAFDLSCPRLPPGMSATTPRTPRSNAILDPWIHAVHLKKKYAHGLGPTFGCNSVNTDKISHEKQVYSCGQIQTVCISAQG